MRVAEDVRVVALLVLAVLAVERLTALVERVLVLLDVIVLLVLLGLLDVLVVAPEVLVVAPEVLVSCRTCYGRLQDWPYEPRCEHLLSE